MYTPDQFKEANPEIISSFVKSNSFGTLISVKNHLPIISHIPFLYVSGNTGHGKLIGHMSKENKHWNQILTGTPVTVIFNGAHGYISPAYYSSPGVPTWNYIVVHIHGVPIIKNKQEDVIEILKKTTDYFESEETGLWQFNIPEDKKKLLLDIIGGFEINITKIEGKFKLSQNRPEVDQVNIIKKLENSKNANEVELSNLMRKYYSELKMSE